MTTNKVTTKQAMKLESYALLQSIRLMTAKNRHTIRTNKETLRMNKEILSSK